jgi:hypothetical protein
MVGSQRSARGQTPTKPTRNVCLSSLRVQFVAIFLVVSLVDFSPSLAFSAPTIARKASARWEPLLASRVVDPESHNTFEGKQNIEARLGKMERTSASTLEGFYEPHLSSFSVKPGSVQVSRIRIRIHMTQRDSYLTCLCSYFFSLVRTIHRISP